MRLWYARRGVAWTPLLACLLLATAAAGAGRHWPEAVPALQPAALACCAAAAGFAFDEAPAAVVAVAPRGGTWRRTTRLGVVVLPLAWWLGAVVAVPSYAATDRAGWLLAGWSMLSTATAAAATGARRGLTAPGGGVAAAVVGVVLTPVVVGPFLGWDPVLPQGSFGDGVLTLWALLGAGALAALVWAVRPGLR